MRFKSAVMEGEDEAELSATGTRQSKTLVLSSRGITSRYRHLMTDLVNLLPNAKKESKFDTKSDLEILNELADLNQCDRIMFFESRKHADLYLWIAKAPEGPTIKFHVLNVHTMDELHFTGNCMQGARPLLSFDSSFSATPEFELIKESLIQAFGVQEGHKKAQPYHDHIFQFSLLDGKVWFRNYQIVKPQKNEAAEEPALIEIGPRFVLDPIRIFEGSFGGRVLFKNEDFISPNIVRRNMKEASSHKYVQRQNSSELSALRRHQAEIPKDELMKIYEN